MRVGSCFGRRSRPFGDTSGQWDSAAWFGQEEDKNSSEIVMMHKSHLFHFSNARAPIALCSSLAGVQGQHHSRKDVRLGIANLRVFLWSRVFALATPLEREKVPLRNSPSSRSAKCTFLPWPRPSITISVMVPGLSVMPRTKKTCKIHEIDKNATTLSRTRNEAQVHRPQSLS